MKKDYYKILEIDKNASEEIIEKAYKTLAKKYHPDLQNEYNQKQCEEKMKQINEAYEILSNDYKKFLYDQELRDSTPSKEDVEKVMNENMILKRKLQQLNYNTNIDYQNENQSTVNRKNTFTFKFNHKPEYYIKRAIILLVIILVLILLYQIPPIKEFCYKIYSENIIVKLLVNSIVNTFKIGF